MGLANTLVEHAFRIAMVCCYQNGSILFQHFFNNSMHIPVYCFHRFDGSLKDTRMANHISISEIDNNCFMKPPIQNLKDFTCHFFNAHFRLEVIRSDPGRRDQDSVFP